MSTDCMTGDYDVSKYDIHVLTGAVKLFFRELSEPLIPINLLDQFIDVYRTYTSNIACSVM